jgi:hypothetical protein
MAKCIREPPAERSSGTKLEAGSSYLQDLNRKLDRIAKMRTKRLLTLIVISLMAFGLIAAAGCASDSEPATPVHSADMIEPIPADQSDNENEPEQSASIGMPAPGFEDVDEMIVLDGAVDSDDEGHDGPIGAPITEGSSARA